ncbi:hypothetical protein AV274_4300, partial [Blastocystis sp. ATCC 50177/Nand II]
MSFYSSPAGIKQDILLSIPETHPISIIISIMMFLSCLFTYPIYSPPLNEILEETVKNKKSVGIFVADSTRLTYRILQTIGISIMGLIGTVISYYVFCLVNVWCASLLVKVNEYTRKNPSKYPPKEIGSDFASITYNILGPKGYYVFVVIYLVTIWGVQVGTLISIVDFICKLPITVGFLGDPSTKRFFFHIISSVICLLFVLLKDISPIIAVASLSIFALLISFVILLVYGFIHYGLTFKTSMLAPVSFGALFASMGVPSFSLGFNFSYMSFFKQVKPSLKNQTKKALTPIIAVITICLLLFPLLALMSFYSSPAGIKQDILLSIPETHPISIIISIMMFLSCLFTYPIYSPPLNEILEETVKNKKSVGIFVADSTRLTYRILQTIGISIMGLIGTVISYYVFCLVNVWCASLLVKVNEYTRKNPSKYPPKEIGSDFASITYNILGPKGYYVFVVIYLVTIWGVQVGTLISIVDFICKLPITVGFLGDPSTKRFFFHIISSVICLLFVLLKDISPIIAVASLSIFALLISFVILLVYGFIHYGLTFKTSMLAPVSFGALFASMGVPSFSLGFNFSYMSFFKQVKPSLKNQTKKALTPIIAVITIC